MHGTIKSLAACAFGAAVIAGCASSPSTSKVASEQGNVKSGKVTAVEGVAVVEQAAVPTGSGSSAVLTTASGVPTVITVAFNDGSQGRYALEQSTAAFTIGEPVSVVKIGDRFIIKTP
jgi:hypothetical protein